LWSGPSAPSYDLLYTLLIVVTTIFPLGYLVWALVKGDRIRSDNDLLEAGMIRFDRLDDRNVIPLAFLTLVLIAVGTALTQSPALRATMPIPLPLAPGRWVAAITTSMGITMLCHTIFTGLGL